MATRKKIWKTPAERITHIKADIRAYHRYIDGPECDAGPAFEFAEDAIEHIEWLLERENKAPLFERAIGD